MSLIRKSRIILLQMRIAQKEADLRTLAQQRHNDAQAQVIIQGEVAHLKAKLRTEEAQL